jgi:hypothetical protein
MHLHETFEVFKTSEVCQDAFTPIAAQNTR